VRHLTETEKSQFETEKSQFEAEKSQFEAEKSQFEAEKSQFETEKSQFETEKRLPQPGGRSPHGSKASDAKIIQIILRIIKQTRANRYSAQAAAYGSWGYLLACDSGFGESCNDAHASQPVPVIAL
jgi:hypothetical protein